MTEKVGQPTISYTEDEIALAFAERYENQLVYVANSTAAMARRWYLKTENGGWQSDMTMLVTWLIRQLCQEIREHCGDAEIVNRLSSRTTFMNIELLCRCDPRLVRTREVMGFLVKAEAKRSKDK